MSKAKINDVDGPYPRRLRKPLPEAVDIAEKILRIKSRRGGACLEAAWTLKDAFERFSVALAQIRAKASVYPGACASGRTDYQHRHAWASDCSDCGERSAAQKAVALFEDALGIKKVKPEDEAFAGRMPCWLIWVILPTGHQALRAVCLSKSVADRYEEYIKETQKVERVMVEESRTNHLYFGAFEKGQTVDPKDVLKALAAARKEYRRPKK